MRSNLFWLNDEQWSLLFQQSSRSETTE